MIALEGFLNPTRLPRSPLGTFELGKYNTTNQSNSLSDKIYLTEYEECVSKYYLVRPPPGTI